MSSAPRLFVALFSLLAAAPVAAIPYDALYNGPTQNGTNFGISASSASAAQAAGIPIITPPVFSGAGVIDIVDQDIESVTLDPGDLVTPFEADSTWTVENIFGSDLDGALYLVFVAVDPRTVVVNNQSHVIDHIDALTGLEIDAAKGWSIVQTTDAQLGTIYYPAISLGSLDDGQQKQFDLRYHLEDLKTIPLGALTVVPMPQMRLAIAFVPVPEPGTALLVALGLAGLATRARQKS